ITYTTESGCDFKIIQMATLEKCVQVMMSKDFNDNYFQECFVLAYRLVTTPDKLLELLGVLFDPNVPEGMQFAQFVKEILSPLRLKIMNFIRIWMKNAWKDFEAKDELIDKLQQFLDRFNRFNAKLGAAMTRQLEHRIAHVDTTNEPSGDLTDPVVLESNSKFVNVLQFHPAEFARQITLLQSEMFKQIPYFEFLGNGWMKKDKETLTPNIMRLVRSTQKLFHFVQTSILIDNDPIKRVIFLHFFIHAADEMRKIKNFEGMKAVVSAIQSSPIFRLKDTWDCLTNDDIQVEKGLESLCDQEKNFSKLREAMKVATPPSIPFLGSTMGDLVFTDDGNKKGDEAKSLINWFKVRGIGNLIKEIMVKQSSFYNFKKLDEFVKYYDKPPILDDQDQLFELSLSYEQKRPETLTSDIEKKISKLRKEGHAAIKKYVKFYSK
ncbi:guanine nucleotide exchange factor, putative, partial [Entamoeba invadens IP1]